MGKPRSKRPNRRPTSAGVSLETLQRAPQLLFRFLLGVAASARARRALEARGLTRAERQRGFELLERLALLDLDDGPDPVLEAAEEAVLAWAATGLELTRVSLTTFPALRDALFAGLDFRADGQRLESIRTLLLRIEAHRPSPDETAQRALAHLATRGVDAARIATLLAQIETAQSLPDPTGASPDAREALLIEIRAYAQEWTGIARLAVTRLDDLASLGLGPGHR